MDPSPARGRDLLQGGRGRGSVTVMFAAASAGTGIAIAAIGIGVVLAISVVFYIVGRGEDRARELAARPAPADDEQPPAAPPADHGDERLRPRGGARARRPR